MIDRPLFFAVVALIVTGIIFSYSLSAYTVLLLGAKPWHFLLRQFTAGVIGIFLMWWIARQPPEKMHWWGMSLFLISMLMILAIPFLPESIAKTVGGARRWIRLGPVSLAPVEFFKIGFVYFLAWSFNRRLIPTYTERQRLGRPFSVPEEILLLLPYLFLAALFLGVIAVFLNDLGQVVVLAATLLLMMLFAGGSLKIFGLFSLSGLIGAVGLIVISPHRIERVKGWWFSIQNTVAELLPQLAHKVPKVNLAEEPYQVSNSLHAIHHGGIFGVGLGNGILKLGFLSEVHTDFVLAGMAEEIGVAGVAAVTLLLFFVIYRLLRIAARVRQDVYYLFASGLAMVMGFAFLINALGVSGVIPLKGIAVPFLSYGGSQIVALCIGMGMALSMGKTAKNL